MSIPNIMRSFHSVSLNKILARAIFLPWCEEAPMEVRESERRNYLRYQFKTAMRVRVWKSGSAERRTESENLSERGAFFATDAPLPVGSAVEILLKMPEEITGKPATEWRCTGHVVRLQPINTTRGKLGVGVQFDCHEILRSKTDVLT